MRKIFLILSSRKFRIGFSVISIYIVLSILSLFSPYDVTQWNVVPRDLPPCWPHILGTNSMGQDVFWILTVAVKNSLLLGITAAVISRIIAVFVGCIPAFIGKFFDKLVTAFVDSFITLPIIPILILLASLTRDTLDIITLGVILALFGWAWDARVIRSQVLSLRERSFIHTALLSGVQKLDLLLGEIAPFLIPIVLSTTISNMFWIMGMEVTLAFLGLSNLEIPTLGTMLYWAIHFQALFLGYWWWFWTPIVAIVVLFIALYLLSLGISEYLDPRVYIERLSITRR